MNDKLKKSFEFLLSWAIKYGNFIPYDFVYKYCSKRGIDDNDFFVLIHKLEKNNILISEPQSQKTKQLLDKYYKNTLLPNNKNIIMHSYKTEQLIQKTNKNTVPQEKRIKKEKKKSEGSIYLNRLLKYSSGLPDYCFAREYFESLQYYPDSRVGDRYIECRISDITNYAYKYAIKMNYDPDEYIAEALALLVYYVKDSANISANFITNLHSRLKRKEKEYIKQLTEDQYQKILKLIKRNNCITCKDVTICPKFTNEITEYIISLDNADSSYLPNYFEIFPIESFYEDLNEEVQDTFQLPCYKANQSSNSQTSLEEKRNLQISIIIHRVLENQLKPMEQIVIKKIFGFDGKESNFREIGKEIGLSPEKIKQIYNISLKKLKKDHRIKELYRTVK